MLEELGLRLKKQLIDTGMLDAIKKIALSTGTVNIDINDLKTFDNKVLTHVIDFDTDTINDDITISSIDKKRRTPLLHSPYYLSPNVWDVYLNN